MKDISYIILIGAVLIVISLTFLSAEGKTIIVDDDWKGADHDNLQDAVDDANGGDKIRVYAGTYVEANVSAHVRLKFIGNGSDDTILDGNHRLDHVHIFALHADDCVVKGFQIRESSGHHEFGGVGIYSDGNDVNNNTFIRCNWAINLLGGHYNSIANNTFYDSNRAALVGYEDSNGNHVFGNKFDSYSSVVWYDGDDNIFKNNTGGGISLGGEDLKISGNSLDGYGSHALRIAGSDISITNNSICGNGGTGIRIAAGSNEINISYNLISGNRNGIYLSNWTGVDSSPEPCTSVEVHRCNIFNNTYHGIDASGNLDDEVDASHNWWGATDGPGGEGPGSGDNVTENVDWDNYLTTNQTFDLPPAAFIVTQFFGYNGISPALWNETTVMRGAGRGAVTRYVWTSSIDGEFYNGTEATIGNSNLSLGAHWISLKVRDAKGRWSDEDTRYLRVHMRPWITNASISPQPIVNGELTTFNVTAYDDGSVSYYRWNSDVRGNLIPFDVTNGNFTLWGLSMGLHNISVWVEDNYGVESIPVNFTVRALSKPRITMANVDPTASVIGTTVSLTAIGADHDGTNNTTFHVVSDVDGVLAEGNGTQMGETFWYEFNENYSGLSYGQHNITFYVQDDLGLLSWNITRAHEVHERPIAIIESIDPDEAMEGSKITFNGSGTDDGNITRYRWTSSIDGLFYNGTSAEKNHSSLSAGDHIIMLEVQDDLGAWSFPMNGSVRVIARPVAEIVTIDPNPALTGSNVSMSGNGSDDDGTIVGYLWESDIDGEIGDEEYVTLGNLSRGSHNITLRVKDDDDVWSLPTNMTLIVHDPPMASIEEIVPNPVNEGDNVTFNGSGTDDRTVVAYEWYLDEDLHGNNTDLITSELPAGTYNVTFRVMDDCGVWSTNATDELIVNAIPTAYFIDVSPDPVNESEPAHLHGGYSDPGDNITVYEWTSDLDGPIADGPEQNVTDLSVGIHNLTFRVQDSNGAWSEPVSRSLTVNGRPWVKIDNIGPGFCNETESVTFTGTAEDHEEDIQEVEWFSDIDGRIGTSRSFSTTNLSAGSHNITLRARDGYDFWSNNATATVVVNGLPVAAIESHSPEKPNEGEGVRLTGGYEDHEDDIDSMLWESDRDGYLGQVLELYLTSLSNGTHNISFSVVDGYGVASNIAYIKITVNGQPRAEIISAKPLMINTSENVMLHGKGIDNEDEALEGRWTSSIDGHIANGSVIEPTGLSNGTHVISFVAIDSNGAESDPATVIIVVNGRPYARIVSVSQDPCGVWDAVNFTGSYLDHENDVSGYLWTSDLDGELSEEMIFVKTGLSKGTHNISFKVKDGIGLWSDEVTRTLNVTSRPEARIIMVWPDPVLEDDVVNLYGEGGPGSMNRSEWWSSIDGPLGSGDSLRINDLTVGSHEIRFRVMSPDGVWSENATSSLEVEHRPRMKIKSISYPSKASAGKIVVIQAEVMNNGSIELDGVSIRFRYDNLTIGTVVLNETIRPRESRSVSIEWSAVNGDHTMFVDCLLVDDRLDTLASGTIQVSIEEVEPSKGPGDDESLYTLYVALFLASLLGTFVAISWKMRAKIGGRQ